MQSAEIAKLIIGLSLVVVLVLANGCKMTTNNSFAHSAVGYRSCFYNCIMEGPDANGKNENCETAKIQITFNAVKLSIC